MWHKNLLCGNYKYDFILILKLHLLNFTNSDAGVLFLQAFPASPQWKTLVDAPEKLVLSALHFFYSTLKQYWRRLWDSLLILTNSHIKFIQFWKSYLTNINLTRLMMTIFYPIIIFIFRASTLRSPINHIVSPTEEG